MIKSPLRRFLAGAIAFGVTLLLAIAGYTFMGCPLSDAVYMVVITAFGVGYGEFCPVTPPGRIFTIWVIVTGVGTAGYAIGGFIQMVTEGEIRQALEHRRKAQDLASLNDHAIICGFGRIGQVLGHKLAAEREAFVIIDSNLERITLAEESGYRVYEGNATDEETLLAAGILRARVLATVLPDDATNVFITLTARELNPHLTIVARGELPNTEKKLRLAGADHVVLPANISGLRMANLITHPNAVEFLDQGEDGLRLNELLAQMDVQLDELAIPHDSPLVGQPIEDLEVRGKGSFIVVALRQANGEMIMHPPHSTTLRGGDTVIVLGHRGDIPKMARMFTMKRQMRYRGASG